MLVIYSYDCNVMKIVPPKGKTEFVLFGLGTGNGRPFGGRSLNEKELLLVAQKFIDSHWENKGFKVKQFIYLKPGQGHEPHWRR